MTETYEDIIQAFEALSPSENSFVVEWLLDETLAMGLSHQGNHCVFMVGQIYPNANLVKKLLRCGTWQTSSGQMLEASLLEFPGEDHFRAATATILVEFLRNDLASKDIAEVFLKVEPLIELVLQRLNMEAKLLLGLMGELLILRGLLPEVVQVPALALDPTAVWQGNTTAARDFAVGCVAIEVKTTTSASSHHRISNLSQVEACELPDGQGYEELYLASVGLVPSEDGRWTLASLVDDILDLLSESSLDDIEGAQQRFLERVSSYGGESAIHYDHHSMKMLPMYTNPYKMTYPPRIYDLADKNIHIIRESDLVKTFISPKGIEFNIELPAAIPDSIDNPRSDLSQICQELVRIGYKLS